MCVHNGVAFGGVAVVGVVACVVAAVLIDYVMRCVRCALVAGFLNLCNV